MESVAAFVLQCGVAQVKMLIKGRTESLRAEPAFDLDAPEDVVCPTTAPSHCKALPSA
jgi:hypothetical protein